MMGMILHHHSNQGAPDLASAGYHSLEFCPGVSVGGLFFICIMRQTRYSPFTRVGSTEVCCPIESAKSRQP